MATALFRDFVYDDATIVGNASGTALTITKGDWVAFSGIYVIAANSGIASYKDSGVGVALANNPVYDELGVARPNTALPILTRGIIRVTGAVSSLGDGSDLLLGTPVFPVTTGSGIVGQTGATGQNAVWNTAPTIAISAAIGAKTANQASGVGILVRIPVPGPASGNSLEVKLFPQRADFGS